MMSDAVKSLTMSHLITNGGNLLFFSIWKSSFQSKVVIECFNTII